MLPWKWILWKIGKLYPLFFLAFFKELSGDFLLVHDTKGHLILVNVQSASKVAGFNIYFNGSMIYRCETITCRSSACWQTSVRARRPSLWSLRWGNKSSRGSRRRTTCCGNKWSQSGRGKHYSDVTRASWYLRLPATACSVQKLTATKKHQGSTLLALCEGNPPLTGGFFIEKDQLCGNNFHTSWRPHVFNPAVSKTLIILFIILSILRLGCCTSMFHSMVLAEMNEQMVSFISLLDFHLWINTHLEEDILCQCLWNSTQNILLIHIRLISFHLMSLKIICLTYWGLVTPYGDIDLGQHWLR